MRGWSPAVMGLVLGTAAVAGAQTAPPNEPPVIVAQGEASISRAPDQAFVQIATEGRGQKPDDARRASAEAMQAVQAALARAGLSADAIRTTGYTLQPEHEYVNGRSQFKDYVARNQIEARVDDVTRLSDVLDAAGGSGATSVAGLRFDLKDRRAVEQQVLRLAVEDAMARANAMAAGAHRTLGPIVRIQEQRAVPTPIPVRMTQMSARAGSEPSTPVSPGQIEIRSQVTLTVEIR